MGFPSSALANGRFPAANQLVVLPGNPQTLLLRATFGLLVSTDQGAHWDWICEGQIGYGGEEDPPVALTANGTALVGTFGGLSTSQDHFCTWGYAPGALANQVIVDLVVRPDDPHTALVLTSSYDQSNDSGTSLFATQTFRSTDDGATWSAYGSPIDPTLVVETVEVAATDPHRLYISGSHGEGAETTAALLESTNDGVTWTAHDIPLHTSSAPTTSEFSAFVSAVDPTHPDTVYVRTASQMTSRLLVTTDAGVTFREVYSGVPLLGFALSPDGGKVYVGGQTGGLMMASTSDFQFSEVSPIQVQCLTQSGATLYACSSDVSGFILGSSSDEGATFSPLLTLTTVRGPLTCAGQNQTPCPAPQHPSPGPVSCCAAAWPATQMTLGYPADAGAGDSPTAAPLSTGNGCGCSMAPPTSAALVLVGAAAGVALTFRRRRRLRRGR